MFGKISIIGCGLIGSSILRVTEEKKLAKKISVHDKSNKVMEYLKKNFTADICPNVTEATKDADLIIISAPLSSYKEILLSIKSNLKEGSILTDTGSTKKEVNKIVNNLGLKNISWIASHPIAGTEHSGPTAGFSSLFKNRWCILSADNQVAKDKMENLEKFWSKLGSKVKVMSFEDHDYVLSLTSHLPHAVAYSIVRTAINNEDKFKNDIIQYLNKYGNCETQEIDLIIKLSNNNMTNILEMIELDGQIQILKNDAINFIKNLIKGQGWEKNVKKIESLMKTKREMFKIFIRLAIFILNDLEKIKNKNRDCVILTNITSTKDLNYIDAINIIEQYYTELNKNLNPSIGLFSMAIEMKKTMYKNK